MKKLLSLVLSIIAVFSVIITILLFAIDILPTLDKKFSHHEYFKTEEINVIEEAVVQKALQMFASSRLKMPWKKQTNFLSKIKNIKVDRKTKIYYYPRAFLALGLVEYSISKNDSVLIEKVKEQFDKYYINDKGLSFDFQFVDQAPIGLAALRLYEYFGDSKYKVAADSIYSKLSSQIIVRNDMQIILYRFNEDKPSDQLPVDVLGMICPFLCEYGMLFNNKEALKLSFSELSFYVRFGLDQKTFLPFHAINLTNNISLGPNNWGRGIGWFMLAASNFYRNQELMQIYVEISHTIESVIKTLDEIKYKQVYSQFPGTSTEFDSSATTMIMYGKCLINRDEYTKEGVLNTLKHYIRKSGAIDFCSGDTYNINVYSKSFGISELSQGTLLRILALYN
ncbi:glycoside hydrolase family 88 protein [Maribellus maritimus]|uniref:glycoside hydrolase family 88 protein n=1 Tax=Maribellus maritimus TaxID=2870838 RepID=UPI001EEC9E07|nr:glycoside hydrolase family 88 protein [Maribellus maritimus]MCG6188644.1 glycoside hydrolase family 88 protein [Maribellus maritimus]